MITSYTQTLTLTFEACDIFPGYATYAHSIILHITCRGALTITCNHGLKQFKQW